MDNEQIELFHKALIDTLKKERNKRGLSHEKISEHAGGHVRQSEKFISSRKTKIENISCNFDLMNKIIYSKNENFQDMNKNLEFIYNFLTTTLN